MIDDKLSLFDGQAITGSNVLSTILDLGSMTDPGEGTPKYVNIEVDTAFSANASQTLRIDLVAKSGSDPATDDKVFELIPATALATTSWLVEEGARRRIPIPPDVIEGYDHIGIAAIPSGTLATGELNADIRLE